MAERPAQARPHPRAPVFRASLRGHAHLPNRACAPALPSGAARKKLVSHLRRLPQDPGCWGKTLNGTFSSLQGSLPLLIMAISSQADDTP
ncbi:hypothetical protein R6Z07F_018594 [Ovis aries]